MLAAHYDVLVMPAMLGAESCADLVRLSRVRVPHAETYAIGGPCPRSMHWTLRCAGLSRYVEQSTIGGFESFVERLCELLIVRSNLDHLGRRMVGLEELKQAQERLRTAMFDEAYRRTSHNKGATARLLGVTRAAVQKIARVRRDGTMDP